MRLGQHFLRGTREAALIADAARITGRDTVFELGTGRGALTRELCRRAGRVISVEADGRLAAEAARSMGAPNLELRHGDGVGAADEFDVFASSIPYMRSREIVEWLASLRFGRGALLVQREFAEKIASPRRAIGVIASHAFSIEEAGRVDRSRFDPPPRVDSVVISITRRNVVAPAHARAIHGLFSYRRKTLRNVLGRFGVESGREGRLEDMGGDEIAGLAAGIAR
ncbi:MAG: ribose ABC transporter permease [Nitrosopumilus sp.]|nr:ribose ABC transporter permease [Nitrosopumilus sp.]MDA7953791.1 ribose ABC transporter permease [Nitrosopumilus sp.]MDA7958649.1 ribose ABC transporter permease [Nitrosopumilus sp.]MDA7998895.1 ribose ABC transporter permease [Nitrosopumilus sp.]